MKFLFLAVVSFSAVYPVLTSALEIQAESTVCITQKHLNRFYSYETEGLKHLTSDMLGRAQCVMKKRPEKVFEVSRSGDFVQVIGVDGFKVWVMADRLVVNDTPDEE